MRPATLPRSSATALDRAGAGAGIFGRAADQIDLGGGLDRALGAISTLRAISCVAAPCSVTAAAMALLISPISRMMRFDRRDRLDRARGGALHAGDLGGDLLGGAAGLPGQRLDLARHHRKAAAGFAGARRFDGGVERQEIGLLGDVGDELDHVADARRRLVQFLAPRYWCGRLR